MSSGPDACDAALLAWANACLQSHSDEPAPTLEAIVETDSVSMLFKIFGLGDPDQGARRNPSQRRRRAAEMLNAFRPGLIEPAVAELGGPAAARNIAAAVLVVAVEAAAKEEAIQIIVGLDQSVQAELARTIQQLMETSQGAAEKKQKQIEADENPFELVRRLSQADQRRFSDVQIAGNDPQVIEPLKAEARELHRELERSSTRFLEAQKAQRAMAHKVADAKAQLCSEADRCVDLLQELSERETEHRSLSRDLQSLKEEMQHENVASLSHQEALKGLGDEIEEERRRYRSLQMNHIDLKAELDQAQHSSAKVETSSWKRTAMMAKLTRLQEKVHCDRTKLADSRRNFEVEEACAASLRQELEEAEDLLSHRDLDLSGCEESFSATEGILHQAESELDSCTNELKAMTSEDLDSLRLEIERKRQALARAEQGSADAVAQRSAIGQQMPEVSAMLEDRRLAAERAVDEAVAAGVAVSTAMQKLNSLSDEATAAAQGLADLATRQPRASLSLTGAAATSLAADADRLQSLSDELAAAKAESTEAESESFDLGQEVQEVKSAKAKAWMVLQQLRKQQEADEEQAAPISEVVGLEAEAAGLSSENGDVSRIREEMQRAEAELHCQEELVESRRARTAACETECEVLQEELRAAASKAEAAVAEKEAAGLGDLDRPPEAEQAEQAEAEKADFSAMVKRSRAATGNRAVKDAAATRLQARQRGIMARSRLTSLRQSRSTDKIQDPSYERPRFPLPPARREEREAAAIKLQAVERGILARSRVQRMREASARGSAKETGARGTGAAALPVDALALQAGEKIKSKAGSIAVLERLNRSLVSTGFSKSKFDRSHERDDQWDSVCLIGKAEFATDPGQLLFQRTPVVQSWSWGRELPLLLAHGRESPQRVMDDARGAFLQRSFIKLFRGLAEAVPQGRLSLEVTEAEGSRGARESWPGRTLLGAPAAALEVRGPQPSQPHHQLSNGTLVATVGTVAISGERQRPAMEQAAAACAEYQTGAVQKVARSKNTEPSHVLMVAGQMCCHYAWVTRTWMQLENTVRAVLFQLRVSWIPASVYKVDICSGRSRTGALLLPCERVDFATLITKSVWPLILFSLQASLCSPTLPLELPTLLPNQSWAECNGRISQSGDRLRLAGMAADLRAGSGERQVMELFLEAIPGRGTDAELLRTDLLSLFNAFGRESGLLVPSSEWHSPSGLPQEALWLSEGLQRLQAQPTLFNIRADTEFFGTDWLPSLQVSLPKEPYIINSHRLPGWILQTVPTVGPDRSLESLQMLQELEEVASILCIFVPAASWMLMLILRCLWDMISGGRRPWSFGSTARSLCRLALMMQAVEMAVYTLATALIVWIVMNGTDLVLLQELVLQILNPSAVLLLVPSLAFGPSGLATLQLLRAPASHCLPVRSRVCCCRLKRQAWARFFAVSALWHALACSAALIESVRLISAGLRLDAPGFQRALQRCSWDLEARCQSSSWRQVPDTRWDLHVRCALACSDVTVSIDDIVLGAIFVICKLLAISAGWSLLARLWCLHLSWRLLLLAAQLARAPVPRAEDAKEVGEHAEAEAQAAAEVLTPSAFQQGVSEAADKASARSHSEEPAPATSIPSGPSPARRALSEAGEASKLQVLRAVMSLDRPPSPSGSAASLDLSDRAERPSAETLKNMLENPLTDGHAELVDFARTIARQCSKGSQAFSEVSRTSSGRSLSKQER
ncbi:slc47a1 [Symbiodinium sp. CCMP2592]|nr:slc47a1 [Symbiodinium sp. CCMP2592]